MPGSVKCLAAHPEVRVWFIWFVDAQGHPQSVCISEWAEEEVNARNTSFRYCPSLLRSNLWKLGHVMDFRSSDEFFLVLESPECGVINKYHFNTEFLMAGPHPMTSW